MDSIGLGPCGGFVSPADVTYFSLIDNKKLKISKLRADSDATFDEKCNFMRLLSFYAGIIQFIISIFQLGKAFDWLPDYFISAFISGVSFHVITSQVFHMFGIAKNGFVIVSTNQMRHLESDLKFASR